MIKKWFNFLIAFLLLYSLVYSLFYNKDGEYKNCEYSEDGNELCTVEYFDDSKLIWVKIYLNGILTEEYKEPNTSDSDPGFNQFEMQHSLYYNEYGNLKYETRTFEDTMFYEKTVYNSTELDNEVSNDLYSGSEINNSGYEETYKYYPAKYEIEILQKKYDKEGKLIYDESGFNWDEKGDLLEISNYESIDNDTIIQDFLNEMAEIKNERLVLIEKMKNERLMLIEKYINNMSFDTMTDSRDGNSYKTITIGEQTWMAENLAHKPRIGGSTFKDENSKINYLYSWNTAIKVCPVGWHLPSNKDWNQFSEMLGGIEVAGVKMKSKTGWKDNGNGTNEIGFNAYPVDGYISWWSSNQNYSGDQSGDVWKSAHTYNLYNKTDALRFNSSQKEDINSVRCIKD